MNLGYETLIIKRAPVVFNQETGASRLDWANATSFSVEACDAQPQEETQGGDKVSFTDRNYTFTRIRFFVPYDTDVRENDRVSWNGDDYDIKGMPEKWRRWHIKYQAFDGVKTNG